MFVIVLDYANSNVIYCALSNKVFEFEFNHCSNVVNKNIMKI